MEGSCRKGKQGVLRKGRQGEAVEQGLEGTQRTGAVLLPLLGGGVLVFRWEKVLKMRWRSH